LRFVLIGAAAAAIATAARTLPIVWSH